MLENTGYHESTSIAMTSTATPSKLTLNCTCLQLIITVLAVRLSRL